MSRVDLKPVTFDSTTKTPPLLQRWCFGGVFSQQKATWEHVIIAEVLSSWNARRRYNIKQKKEKEVGIYIIKK